MTSNKDIEPTHYGTDYSLSGISDNDLWIENSSQISKENMCKTTVLNLLQLLDQYIKGRDKYFTLLSIQS